MNTIKTALAYFQYPCLEENTHAAVSRGRLETRWRSFLNEDAYHDFDRVHRSTVRSIWLPITTSGNQPNPFQAQRPLTSPSSSMEAFRRAEGKNSTKSIPRQGPRMVNSPTSRKTPFQACLIAYCISQKREDLRSIDTRFPETPC